MPKRCNEVPLESYEEEVLIRMYNEGLIRHAYKSIQRIRSKVRWDEIAERYRVTRSFEGVIRHLARKGYIDLHGKRGDVASLSSIGVSYVWAKLKERNSTS